MKPRVLPGLLLTVLLCAQAQNPPKKKRVVCIGESMTANTRNLDYFGAVLFYATGELDMDDEQKATLLSFVKNDRKGFIGTHSATGTL